MAKIATDENNYFQQLIEYRERDNYDSVFRSTVEDLAGQVDFSWVKSCVAVGTGSGEHEMLFARRLLPNLQEFTAVEPDPESVKALRANFQDGQLPGVKTTVLETTVENWSGLAGKHVDAVLFFGVLWHVKLTERRALFQRLMTKILEPGGIVVEIEESWDGFGLNALNQRFKKSCGRYEEVEQDVLAAGFTSVLKQRMSVTSDLSNPTENIVKLIKTSVFRDEVTDEEVRAAIEDIYSQPSMRTNLKILAIFRK